MAHLSLSLLGGFRLSADSAGEVRVSSKRAQTVLAVLGMGGSQKQRRDRLIGMLWPDRGEEQARHSLRQELSSLRRALADNGSVLQSDGDFLSINPDAMEVDVTRFERLAQSKKTDQMEQAAALYAGDLLEGMGVGSPAFHHWLEGERARLKDSFLALLESLAEAKAAANSTEAALEFARKLASEDPLREQAHRLLMRLYAQFGRRSDAVRQYQTCSKILRRELDVEPDPATRELYANIRSERDYDDQAAAFKHAPTSHGDLAEQSGLPLPSKPSLAVMPFDNMSGDLEQEYFADGVVGDIITKLGRFRWCHVIARNSTFAFKGVTVDVREVARDLGVRYVLEGSLRRAGSRVRITTELSDVTSGKHIWAERFDRDLGDLFDLQEEISQAVITSIAPQFLTAEAERAGDKDRANFDAWDYCVRARWHLWRFNQSDSTRAQDLIGRALELDGEFAPALADLASLYVIDGLCGWNRSMVESFGLARKAADKALHFDDNDAWAHAVVGLVDAFSRNYDVGIRRLERAVDINPNLSAAHGFLGWAWIFSGDSERGVRSIEDALRLSPYDPLMVFWYGALSAAAFATGCYEDAASWARRAVADRTDFPSGHRLLAASLGQLGEEKEARAVLQDVLRLIPDETIQMVRNQVPYKKDMSERFLEGLRRAGLPEE